MINASLIDSIQFAAQHMNDDEVTAKSLSKMSAADRKARRVRLGLERRTITEQLLDFMEDGVWYAYDELAEKTGVPKSTIQNLLHRMLVGRAQMVFDHKKDKVNGVGQLVGFLRVSEDETLFKVGAEKPHDVPSGYDASLLAASFPKYCPVIEEEEECVL